MPTHTPRSRGRTGRPWRRAQARCLQASDVCWICGKHGADTADHIIPVAHLAHDDPLLTDQTNLRPAHRSCNSRRGTGEKAQTLRVSRQW